LNNVNNQFNTSSHFYSKPNPSIKKSIEDFKGEIVSIRKKNPKEVALSKEKMIINNKQLSKFTNLKPLNNPSSNIANHNNNEINSSTQFPHKSNPIETLNEMKSYMNESNNNNFVNSLRSKSTSNKFLSPHTKKNSMGNTVKDDEQTIYVTQSVRTGFHGIPEHLERKYNITSKNSINSWNAINKIFNKRNQGFFCPHCEHCNNIQDENLEKYFAMKEAKNIIKKGFDYICEYYENDQSFLDFLINTDQGANSFNSNNVKNNINNNNTFDLNHIVSNANLNNIDNHDENYVNKYAKNNNNSGKGNHTDRYNANNSSVKKIDNINNIENNTHNLNLLKKNRSPNKSIIKSELNNSHFPKGQNNKNYNMNIINGELENIKNNKKISKFDLENLLLTYPKLSTDRNVLQLVTHFLDALINDKISLDYIITPEIYDKLKENLIAQGFAFRAKDNELEFDQEIDLLFDEATREKIKKLFKCIKKNIKKYLMEKF